MLSSGSHNILNDEKNTILIAAFTFSARSICTRQDDGQKNESQEGYSQNE